LQIKDPEHLSIGTKGQRHRGTKFKNSDKVPEYMSPMFCHPERIFVLLVPGTKFNRKDAKKALSTQRKLIIILRKQFRKTLI